MSPKLSFIWDSTHPSAHWNFVVFFARSYRWVSWSHISWAFSSGHDWTQRQETVSCYQRDQTSNFAAERPLCLAWHCKKFLWSYPGFCPWNLSQAPFAWSSLHRAISNYLSIETYFEIWTGDLNRRDRTGILPIFRTRGNRDWDVPVSLSREVLRTQ